VVVVVWAEKAPRAFLPRTPQWQALQSRSSPAHTSRVFALFRFE